jgi:hypothetical protein
MPPSPSDLWRERLRPRLATSPAARKARDEAVHAVRSVRNRLPTKSFWQMRPEQAIRVAYNVMLNREPDPGGYEDRLQSILNHSMTVRDLPFWVRGSEEAVNGVRFPGHLMGPALHVGRCQFIRSFPAARRIVDLGGSHSAHAVGAMVAMGYPYPFDELVIIDLPPDERHPLYRYKMQHTEHDAPQGTVRYRYHSMIDLGSFDDGSVDLVYSGQSIEHVNEADGDKVLSEVWRILRPGGWLALDTPNGRVTRLQQDAFIDPDHEIEYTDGELTAKLENAGFVIEERKGIAWAGRCLAEGRWDPDEVAGNAGLFAQADECYLLCYLARKPA